MRRVPWAITPGERLALMPSHAIQLSPGLFARVRTDVLRDRCRRPGWDGSVPSSRVPEPRQLPLTPMTPRPAWSLSRLHRSSRAGARSFAAQSQLVPVGRLNNRRADSAPANARATAQTQSYNVASRRSDRSRTMTTTPMLTISTRDRASEAIPNRWRPIEDRATAKINATTITAIVRPMIQRITPSKSQPPIGDARSAATPRSSASITTGARPKLLQP